MFQSRRYGLFPAGRRATQYFLRLALGVGRHPGLQVSPHKNLHYHIIMLLAPGNG